MLIQVILHPKINVQESAPGVKELLINTEFLLKFCCVIQVKLLKPKAYSKRAIMA